MTFFTALSSKNPEEFAESSAAIRAALRLVAPFNSVYLLSLVVKPVTTSGRFVTKASCDLVHAGI